MNNTYLERSQLVLRQIAEGVYADDDSCHDTLLRLDPGAWSDMGAPEVITVTVEPGDRLNHAH